MGGGVTAARLRAALQMIAAVGDKRSRKIALTELNRPLHTPPVDHVRLARIAQLRSEGKLIREIADELGLSAARISQIIHSRAYYRAEHAGRE